MKKVLLLLGHPSTNSFNKALLDAYAEELRKKDDVEVKELYLGELDFDPILHEGYNQIQDLEPDLVRAQEMIKWADHISFFYPIWWGTMPAVMKGFFDRAILPGFAFKYREGKMMPDKLLAGRTVDLFVTMGAVPWMYKLLGAPHFRTMKIIVLGFCGLKVRNKMMMGSIKKETPEDKFKGWLEKVRQMGKDFS